MTTFLGWLTFCLCLLAAIAMIANTTRPRGPDDE